MKVLEGQRGARCSEAEYLTFTHRRCHCCNKLKSLTLFYKKKSKKIIRGWYWESRCIECSRNFCKTYAADNREKRNARLRKWRKKNPEHVRMKDKNKTLKFKYGLSVQQLELMRETQNGCCAICEKSTTRLFVDHCHTLGHVRALLCQTCNTFLGWYEKKADVILKFQEYIAKHRK